MWRAAVASRPLSPVRRGEGEGEGRGARGTERDDPRHSGGAPPPRPLPRVQGRGGAPLATISSYIHWASIVAVSAAAHSMLHVPHNRGVSSASLGRSDTRPLALLLQYARWSVS